MKKDNQLARIEQFLGQLQSPESNDAVILLDSEMESTGADGITPKANDNCINASQSGCATTNGICENRLDACAGSSNTGRCFNDKAPVVSVGCGSTVE